MNTLLSSSPRPLPNVEGDLPFRGVYHPLGFGVEICTNDSLVLDQATEIWGHLKPRQIASTVQVRIIISESGGTDCPPGPRFNGQRHLMSLVADADNYAICDLRAGFAYAFLSRAALQHPLYFRYHFLEAMALGLVSSVHAPALHAACVSVHGKGFLLCGPSGAGKSTLAYACARGGFTYITDDSSYLLPGTDHPRVVGHSHKIRFRLHSRELFPELKQRELAPRMEGKPSIEVPTAELIGVRTAQEARIYSVILLNRQPGAGATLIPIPSTVALASLHESLYPVDEIRRDQIVALDKLKGIRAYEFRYSALDEAVHCLRELAENPDRLA